MTAERLRAELLSILSPVREQRIWRYLLLGNKGKQGRFPSARTQVRPFEEAHECRMPIDKIDIRLRLFPNCECRRLIGALLLQEQSPEQFMRECALPHICNGRSAI